MVFIKGEIERLKERLIKDNIEIDTYLYNYINDIENNTEIITPNNFKELAICGYSKKAVDKIVFNDIIYTPPIKNMDYKSNIYELLGIFLVNKENKEVEKALIEKYEKTTLENKYLIYKIYPRIEENLRLYVEENEDINSNIIRNILNNKIEFPKEEVYIKFIENANSISDLIILEDLYRKSIKMDIQYREEPKDIILNILNEFPNAVKSITQQRRKGHELFRINDEYDVQDLLYFVLKSIFPKMIPEENTPQVGGKTERADFIFSEFDIILEIKMIKEKDYDEKKFIEQIKIDIQSYYRIKPKYMIFFIYDPQNKTKDKKHFEDLQGIMTIKDETGKYNFETITVLKN
jgi:hypothetical protein